MTYDKEQLKRYAENKAPVKEYLDLAAGEKVINIDHKPQQWLTKKVIRHLKWRIFILNVRKFFGDKRVK